MRLKVPAGGSVIPDFSVKEGSCKISGKLNASSLVIKEKFFIELKSFCVCSKAYSSSSSSQASIKQSSVNLALNSLSPYERTGEQHKNKVPGKTAVEFIRFKISLEGLYLE